MKDILVRGLWQQWEGVAAGTEGGLPSARHFTCIVSLAPLILIQILRGRHCLYTTEKPAARGAQHCPRPHSRNPSSKSCYWAPGIHPKWGSKKREQRKDSLAFSELGRDMGERDRTLWAERKKYWRSLSQTEQVREGGRGEREREGGRERERGRESALAHSGGIWGKCGCNKMAMWRESTIEKGNMYVLLGS